MGVAAEAGAGTEEETLDFLQSFLRYTQPKVIVEAGTCQGNFVAVAHMACPKAAIYTADIFEHKWICDVRGWAVFFAGDFEEMLKAWFTCPEIDFAFIDSGPPSMRLLPKREPGVRLRHYNAVLPYMKKGGIIATHDTRKTDWTGASTIIEDAGMNLNSGRGLSLRQV